MNADLQCAIHAMVGSNMVRIAPDTAVWIPKNGEPDRYCLARWTPQGAGYVPMPIGGRLAQVTPALLRAIGITDHSIDAQRQTLHRLARAGFIELIHLSPGVWLLDLDSWFRHLQECQEHADLWDPGSPDLARYLDANGLRHPLDATE